MSVHHRPPSSTLNGTLRSVNLNSSLPTNGEQQKKSFLFIPDHRVYIQPIIYSPVHPRILHMPRSAGHVVTIDTLTACLETALPPIRGPRHSASQVPHGVSSLKDQILLRVLALNWTGLRFYKTTSGPTCPAEPRLAPRLRPRIPPVSVSVKDKRAMR